MILDQLTCSSCGEIFHREVIPGVQGFFQYPNVPCDGCKPSPTVEEIHYGRTHETELFKTEAWNRLRAKMENSRNQKISEMWRNMT